MGQVEEQGRAVEEQPRQEPDVEPAGLATVGRELGEGALSITADGKTESLTVSGGYVEIRDNRVRVLADRVER